ncbi:MAG: hypothetical protein ACOX7K_09955 [Oscillospiraceae bacterium]
MTYLDEIYGCVESLLGCKITDQQVTIVRTVCEAAGSELLARMKQGVDLKTIKPMFISAAGILALSMYIQLENADEIATFSAGNLSVSKRTHNQVSASAHTLRKQAETMLAAYLVDNGFDFRGVQA